MWALSNSKANLQEAKNNGEDSYFLDENTCNDEEQQAQKPKNSDPITKQTDAPREEEVFLNSQPDKINASSGSLAENFMNNLSKVDPLLFRVQKIAYGAYLPNTEIQLLYQVSKSHANFATQLVFTIFTNEERNDARFPSVGQA
uniref:Uncharacterized protein n=1 Tax=Romanomermis culicivorax TaxID=13658 RepID=A0A915IP58_ROMCU